MARAPAAGGVIIALLLSCGASATLADAGGGTTATKWREAVLELRLNGVAAGEGVIALRDDAGGLWLGEQDFARLRLRVPPGTPHVVQGQRYFPLAAIPGTSVTFDEAHSEVLITAPASAFQSSSVSLAGTPRPGMSRSGTGAFLNYIAYGQRGQYRGGDVARFHMADAGLTYCLGQVTIF